MKAFFPVKSILMPFKKCQILKYELCPCTQSCLAADVSEVALPAVLTLSSGHEALWLSFRHYMFTVVKLWFLDLVVTHLSLSYSVARNVRNRFCINLVCNMY